MNEANKQPIGIFQDGHILTLSGFWKNENTDDFKHALGMLRAVLPRTQTPQHVTLHLLNFSMEHEALRSHLSALRLIFFEQRIHVNLVAQGSLDVAGLLFLASARVGRPGEPSRKIFSDTEISIDPRFLGALVAASPLGFAPPDRAAITPPVCDLNPLPEDWKKDLRSGTKLTPTPEDCLKADLVDKIIPAPSFPKPAEGEKKG